MWQRIDLLDGWTQRGYKGSKLMFRKLKVQITFLDYILFVERKIVSPD